MSVLESAVYREAEELSLYTNLDKVDELTSKRLGLESKKVDVKDQVLDCKKVQAVCDATLSKITATTKICAMAGIKTSENPWSMQVAADALKEIGYDVLPEELKAYAAETDEG